MSAGGTMHFSVDGDWLCQTVRDTVLSERWDTAMRILREVEGLTREQEEGILKGDLTLLSDLSDIVPLDDERKAAYQKDVAYIYAGRAIPDGEDGVGRAVEGPMPWEVFIRIWVDITRRTGIPTEFDMLRRVP